MDSDKGARAPKPAPTGMPAPTAPGERGPTPAEGLVRVASALGGAAASITVREIGATLRLAGLATGLFRTSADLAARTGQALGRLSGAPQNLPEEANRALVLRLYRAAVQADLTTARKLLAEGIRWQVPGPEPAAGHYRGIAETVPAPGALWRQMGGITAIELRDVVASPERAAALVRLSVVRNGRPAVRDWWLILRVDVGQVTEAWGPFATERVP
jgi:ketosteroid isomerase-like protein